MKLYCLLFGHELHVPGFIYDLARYNSQVGDGIIHTEAKRKQMKIIQKEFDALMKTNWKICKRCGKAL